MGSSDREGRGRANRPPHKWLRLAAAVAVAMPGLHVFGRPPKPPPLEIEYRGCFSVFGPPARPTCGLRATRDLDLWVRSDPGARLEVRAGSEVWEPSQARPVEAGYRFELTGLDAREIVVRAVRGETETVRVLRLEPPRDTGEDTHLLDAGALASEQARTALANSEIERARELTEQAVRHHEKSGNLAYLVYDLTFLHFLLFNHFDDLEAARDVLFGRMPEIAAGDGESAFLVAFYRGQWAIATGDVRTALAELDAAARQAERLGQVRFRNMARQLFARQLRRLGRHEEAMELFASLVREIGELHDDCERAKLLNNTAWDRLLALEAGIAADNPAPELERALALVDDCRDPAEEGNLRLNLALAHLWAGDPARARRELDRARTTERPGWWLKAWLFDAEGRIALAEGRATAALSSYALAKTAAQPWPGVAWRAAVGRARALEATGDTEAALAELARAERLLDEESRQAPVDAGRETSVRSREAGTRFYLDLLLRAGRDAEALAVARRSRSRLFRGLARDARRLGLDAAGQARWGLLVGRYNQLRDRLERDEAEDWAVPAEHEEALIVERAARRRELSRLLDEALALIENEPGDSVTLPPVLPGEVLLVYHPAPDGWLGFAADETGVDVARFGPVRSSSPGLDGSWLEPFAERIRRAERVRVLPYGELGAVDFHTLPFDGDVLLATAPVVYGLDLAPAVPRSGRRALVVADPSGSLPAARREAAAVESALERQGWNLEVFGNGDALGDAGRLRRRLPEADLLHFAGHADFAGHSTDGGLLFDRDGTARLTVGDILTRPGVPGTVVLSACATARTARPEAPAGLGVSHAFLLAGSQVAIGAVRRVDDRTTAALVRLFYSDWDGTPESAAAALAAAQLFLRREDPEADWAAFRVLER